MVKTVRVKVTSRKVGNNIRVSSSVTSNGKTRNKVKSIRMK